jgi:hypothetical protein
MARVLVAAQTTPGAYPTLPLGANSRDLQMQAGDSSLGNYTPLVEGKTLVLFQNTGVGARTVTFTSQADVPYNRTGDISAYSIGAGELALFGPFKAVGWSDSGNLDIDVSNAEVLIAVITIP